MAEFDDWGTPPGGQDAPYQGDDEWGSFGGDDDWGTPTQPDDFGGDSQPDTFAPQPDGFQAQQGSFIPQDDDGWGSTSGVEEPQIATQNPNDFASSEAEIQEYQPKRFNLSMKMVALIILGACIVVALVFLGLDKIHITKKPTQQNNPPVVQQDPNQGASQGNQGQQAQQGQQGGNSGTGNNVSIDSVTLVEIPDSMTLDYNVDVLEINGKVINKLKYVQAHQVLYCINIGVAFGSSTETVSYYCSYSSYNAVKEGDIVVLRYQQVNESYISILSVSK